MNHDLDRLSEEQIEAMRADHDVTGPHEHGDHRIVNDWDVKTHFCVDCGLASISRTAIEAEECDTEAI